MASGLGVALITHSVLAEGAERASSPSMKTRNEWLLLVCLIIASAPALLAQATSGPWKYTLSGNQASYDAAPEVVRTIEIR